MKDAFVKSFKSVASVVSINSWVKLTGFNVSMPFYHTVSNEHLPHIKPLYNYRNEEEFIKELDFYLKHFEPIDLQTLISGNLQKNKKYLFLSFDDGLREISDVIEPILTKKGIPATFFINSGFVDNKDLFYKFKAALIYNKTQSKSLNNSSSKEISSILEKNHLWSAIDINITEGLIERINNITEIDFNDFLKTEKPYLDSLQIENLVNKGFTIGAHSVNHPYFDKITDEEKFLQIGNSLSYIKQTFNIKHKAFSFPFSDFNLDNKFFNDMSNLVDISFGTAGIKKDSIASNYQRIPIEKYRFSADKIIKSEYFYYFLSSLAGKNIIKR